MKALQLYRKRLIPFETVSLKDDVIIEHNSDVIVTKWKPIRPRKDFSHGYSCVFLKKGIKVSKIYNNGDLLYYYCDIVDTVFSESDNSCFINDLLVDVIVMPDGFVKVLDVEELAYALDEELITQDVLKRILNILSELLKTIYDDKFSDLTRYLDEIV